MEGRKNMPLLDSIEHIKSVQKNCYYCGSKMTVEPAVAKFQPNNTYVGDLPHLICKMCDEKSQLLSVGVATANLIKKHDLRGTVYLAQLLKAEKEDADLEQDNE